MKFVDPSGHNPLAVIGVAALMGLFMGGMSALANGGDIMHGMINGAIAGAVSGAMFYAAPAIGAEMGIGAESAWMAALHVVGGAASGAVGAAMTGGDIGQGALIGALSAGAAKYFGGAAGLKLPGRMMIGAAAGGLAAAWSGGDIAQGAFWGAWTSAIADICNRMAHTFYSRWYYDKWGRAFLESLRETNPVEYALFVEFAKNENAELWTGDRRWDEVAFKKFDGHVRGPNGAAADLISKNFKGIYKGIYGPLGVITKYFSGAVNILVGTYSDFGTAAGMVSLTQIGREASNIMFNGPAVINESYWGDYTPGLH